MDDRLRVTRLAKQTEQHYWREIAKLTAKLEADERSGVVFLHGYNVSFKEAALRTAQIGYDLNLHGPVSFFSWPSRGTLLGYPADEASIEASEADIAQYLMDFARNSGVERVHVIAHSMGNRGLLRAIQRILALAGQEPEVRFGHFILAAPDIDRDLFLGLAASYRQLSARTTLYISDRDRALGMSRFIRAGSARAGFAPPITVAPGIDTVYVANVDVTLLGHGYVAETREVLGDMHELLTHDAPPDRRMGTRRKELDDGQVYWVIRR